MPRGLKFFLSSLLIGAMSLGAAWAGAVLVPADPTAATSDAPEAQGWLAGVESDGEGEQRNLGGFEALQTNQVYAGAYKVNIAPRPADYAGEWNTTDCDATFA